MYSYLAGALINVFGIKRRQLSYLQEFLADEDAFTIITLFFMQLCSAQLRLVYTVALMLWALVNVAELGLRVTKSQRIAGLVMLHPYFCSIVANEIMLVKIKSHIEVCVAMMSPLLWFPVGWCAPLLPLLGLQVIRLKYVICEFTRCTFTDLDVLMKLVLPPVIASCVDKWIKPRLLAYVSAASSP